MKITKKVKINKINKSHQIKVKFCIHLSRVNKLQAIIKRNNCNLKNNKQKQVNNQIRKKIKNKNKDNKAKNKKREGK